MTWEIGTPKFGQNERDFRRLLVPAPNNSPSLVAGLERRNKEKSCKIISIGLEKLFDAERIIDYS
jgi:hypothetical protein